MSLHIWNKDITFPFRLRLILIAGFEARCTLDRTRPEILLPFPLLRSRAFYDEKRAEGEQSWSRLRHVIDRLHTPRDTWFLQWIEPWRLLDNYKCRGTASNLAEWFVLFTSRRTLSLESFTTPVLVNPESNTSAWIVNFDTLLSVRTTIGLRLTLFVKRKINLIIELRG